MDRVRHLVLRVADANCAVLIRGETGTGKEIVARALHEVSGRRGWQVCIPGGRPLATTSRRTILRLMRYLQPDGSISEEGVQALESAVAEAREMARAENVIELLATATSAVREAALGLVASLVSGDGAVHEVDVRNAGTLEGLAADDVVEIPARVTQSGAEPLAQPPLAPIAPSRQ